MQRFTIGDVMPIYDRAGRRKYLTAAERERFLTAADRQALRRRALLYVLAFSGCRISEALNLATHQVDPERGTLTFRTLKRRKLCFRSVPVPPEVICLLCRTPVGPDGRFWPVHRATAWRWVKQAMHRARISGPAASPKGTRHGFGIRAASKNIPLPLIQRWMGHAQPTTTAIYLEAVDDEERQLAERMW